MKSTQKILGLSLASLVLVAGAARADAPATPATQYNDESAVVTAQKTRAQAKEELRAAYRNGEMETGYVAVVNGELDASRYPFKQQAAFARAKSGDIQATTSAGTQDRAGQE
jgi:hypothetical protein